MRHFHRDHGNILAHNEYKKPAGAPQTSTTAQVPQPTSADIGFLPPINKANKTEPTAANVPRSDTTTRRGGTGEPGTYGGLATYTNESPSKFVSTDVPRMPVNVAAVGGGAYSRELESRLLENERIQRTLVQNTLKFQNEMSENLRSHSNLLKDEQQTRRYDPMRRHG